jgi:hypothetical protein
MSNKPVTSEAVGLSFQEKSQLVSLINTVVIFGGEMVYFLCLEDPDVGDFLGLMIGVTVLLVIVEIVAHILLAIGWREEGPDERDRHIALLGARVGYVILTTGTVSVMLFAVFSLPRVWLAFGLLTTLVVAEVAKFAAQLLYYRRGG